MGLGGFVHSFIRSGKKYLSQEGQMLDDQMGTFCLSSTTFPADDNALNKRDKTVKGTAHHMVNYSYYCSNLLFSI